jgi:hypothetical protein
MNLLPEKCPVLSMAPVLRICTTELNNLFRIDFSTLSAEPKSETFLSI